MSSFQARGAETSPNADTWGPLQARPRVTALQTTCRPHVTGHPCEYPQLYTHTNSDFTKPTENTVKHDLFIPANVSLLLHRTTLKLWRIPLTYPPSSASWIRVSIRSRGSMWTMCGSCSTMPGCTTAKHPVSTSTALNWQKCLKRRLIRSCRAWATAAAGRWDTSGWEMNTTTAHFTIFTLSVHIYLKYVCSNDMDE